MIRKRGCAVLSGALLAAGFLPAQAEKNPTYADALVKAQARKTQVFIYFAGVG